VLQLSDMAMEDAFPWLKYYLALRHFAENHFVNKHLVNTVLDEK